ncbi:MAG: universal stress protein [Pseudomonadota bacterium]
MSYKTIVVHLDHTTRCAERVQLAAQLALREQAHLVGAAFSGLSPYFYAGAGMGVVELPLAAPLEEMQRRAEMAIDNFLTTVPRLGVQSYEGRLVRDEAGVGMNLQARYADLVVIGQTDGSDVVPGELPDFPSYVMMHSARPLLLVPSKGHFADLGDRPLVAWNASREATRALASALPLLKKASMVDVVIINAYEEPDMHGEQPGADIGLYLARHGVKVDVHNLATELDTGNALLSLAADLSSDMLVTGGYGHSRFREILLGGATRTLFNNMALPLWLAH